MLLQPIRVLGNIQLAVGGSLTQINKESLTDYIEIVLNILKAYDTTIEAGKCEIEFSIDNLSFHPNNYDTMQITTNEGLYVFSGITVELVDKITYSLEPSYSFRVLAQSGKVEKLNV